MTQRLSSLDATFLFAELPAAALHIGAVLMFAPPDGGTFDVAGFIAGIDERLGSVPRLRQRVRRVPGGLGLPVWVDDDRFDLAFHVRHLALPAPRSEPALRELVAGLMEAPLDRDRPLWELAVVEGLPNGRTAAVMKIHHALADGLSCMELAAVLLDATPQPPPDDWQPAPAPSGLELTASAAAHGASTARSVLTSALATTLQVTATATRAAGREAQVATVARVAGSALAHARRALTEPLPALHAGTGTRRRFATVRTTLAEHRSVRRAHGGTVNDVALTVVAGGLRRWLLHRGQRLSGAATVRAMVPVSLRGRARSASGNDISAHVMDLPVGIADPLTRLAAVRAAMDERKRRGPAAADALAELARLSPPLLHEWGAGIAARHVGRLYDVLVTNIPGPPRTVHTHGAALEDLFPVVPLGHGQAVGFGLVTCGPNACYGITADHDAVPDVDVLADALEASLAELVVRTPVPREPRMPRPSSVSSPEAARFRRDLLAALAPRAEHDRLG